jgi:hypothetical protein
MTSPLRLAATWRNGGSHSASRRLLTRKRPSHEAWRSSMNGDGVGQVRSLTRPAWERLTLPLTVRGELGKRWSAQRWSVTYSHGGSQGFKSPHLHPTLDDQRNRWSSSRPGPAGDGPPSRARLAAPLLRAAPAAAETAPSGFRGPLAALFLQATPGPIAYRRPLPGRPLDWLRCTWRLPTCLRRVLQVALVVSSNGNELAPMSVDRCPCCGDRTYVLDWNG